MEVRFTGKDFARLIIMSCHWHDDLASQDRWEEIDSSFGESWIGWKRAYWVGDTWLNVIFTRAWLEQNAERYEILWDTDRRGYVILTDYDTDANKD